MEGLLGRGRRAELYNGPTLSQAIEDVDDRLFSNIVYNEHHLLHRLLPESHYTNYSLMPVSHCPYGFYDQVTVETVG